MGRRVGVVMAVAGLSVGWARAQNPAGAEFRFNTHTTAAQFGGSVATDAAGNFVAVWSSVHEDPAASVFARRYNAAGVPLGAEFRVNTYTTGWQAGAAVAVGARGDFIVAWQSNGQDGSEDGIFGQRFDASGTPRGVEFLVNAYTTGSQREPAVASDAAGNFVVVWRGAGQGESSEIFGQRYDALGVPRGAQFRANTYTFQGQYAPAIASDAAGNFVAVWMGSGQDGAAWDVLAQRYDAAGTPRGAEFRVNSYTTGYQAYPSVAANAAGSFVVAWQSAGQDGSSYGVFAQRYDGAGAPLGVEFLVNSYTTDWQGVPLVALDEIGQFYVAWASQGQDASDWGAFRRKYRETGAPLGSEFRVNSYTTGRQIPYGLAADQVGNVVVTWESTGQDGSGSGVFGQRLGGLRPVALAADRSATSNSDGNNVLEPNEGPGIEPWWWNVSGSTQTFTGLTWGLSGPQAPGVSYWLVDASASYGPIANGATATCTDCYRVMVALNSTRPWTHWDAVLREDSGLGLKKLWMLHVGDSFTDVPKTSAYYRFVETLLHHGVTGGCSSDAYCPANVVTREQVAVFVLAAKEGPGYRPSVCGAPVFGDVPASSPFCRFVEELSRRGVVGGCGGGNYCPASAVTREQMPVFVLLTLDPAINPPACGTPVFADVPAASPFCRWIEELSRRGVVSGCGGGNYCPADAVTREQMAVFIAVTFGLSLYGP